MVVEKLMRIDTISDELGISKSTMYKKVTRNKVPFYKWNGLLYFDLSEIINMIKNG